MSRSIIMCLLWLIAAPVASRGEAALPPCFERPTYRGNPWVDGSRWCLEQVIRDESAGRLGFSALATAPDGTLYATRPLTGELIALTDSDGDGLPDTPDVIASGLDYPNGLAFHDGALYVSGGARIDRLRDGDQVTVVDDIPTGTGFWTGDLVIGADERIYIATGAPCAACDRLEAGRGLIFSYDLDGGDRQVIATGLRHPADLAFRDGVLWALDSQPDDSDQPDELNQIIRGFDYGYPDCVGCADPVFTFPAGSHPVGLASYTHDALPGLNGALLVTLFGSNNQANMSGYALVAVVFNGRGEPVASERLLPGQNPADAEQFTLQEMNYRYSGLWPQRPLDVAVSPAGWVYVSIGDGEILALRPLAESD